MLKNVYSLDGLLLKKKDLQVIKVLNILRVFSSLNFFKVDYYPFSYNKFLVFCNKMIKYIMAYRYVNYLKGLSFYFIKVYVRNKNLRKKWGSVIKVCLKRYRKGVKKILKKLDLKKLRRFLKFKFRFKKLKKIRFLQKYKFSSRVKKRQSKIDITKMNFFGNLLKNKKNLMIVHQYIRQRYSKTFKKKHLYLNKKKQDTIPFLQKRFADSVLYKRIYKKVRRKKKFIFRKLRLKLKGKKFWEKKEIAADYFKMLSTDKKRLRRVLKKRRRKFLRKFFLIKKYKRLVFRRKNKRIGILHFKMFYSNYYVTLTDLSHNVIFSCSAGSVSDTNNKKTKMSNVVSMPIFFRILFFLRAFRIKNLKFVIRNRMDKMCFSALKFFKKKGYRIRSFSFVKKGPHHLGQRTQKPRRI